MSTECIPGEFGPDCEFSCDSCLNGGSCTKERKGCLCSPGWTDLLCNATCPEVSHPLVSTLKQWFFIHIWLKSTSGFILFLFLPFVSFLLLPLTVSALSLHTSLSHWSSPCFHCTPPYPTGLPHVSIVHFLIPLVFPMFPLYPSLSHWSSPCFHCTPPYPIGLPRVSIVHLLIPLVFLVFPLYTSLSHWSSPCFHCIPPYPTSLPCVSIVYLLIPLVFPMFPSLWSSQLYIPCCLYL